MGVSNVLLEFFHQVLRRLRPCNQKLLCFCNQIQFRLNSPQEWSGGYLVLLVV